MTLIKSNAHRDISRHKNRNAGFFFQEVHSSNSRNKKGFILFCVAFFF